VGNYTDVADAISGADPKGVFIMNDIIELKLDKEAETVSRN